MNDNERHPLIERAKDLADDLYVCGVWDAKAYESRTKKLRAGRLSAEWKRRMHLTELTNDQLTENLQSLLTDQQAMNLAGGMAGGIAIQTSFATVPLAAWAGIRGAGLAIEHKEIIEEAERRTRKALNTRGA